MSLVVIVGVNTGHYHHDDNHGHCYAQRPVIILMSYTCFHPYYYTSVTQSSTHLIKIIHAKLPKTHIMNSPLGPRKWKPQNGGFIDSIPCVSCPGGRPRLLIVYPGHVVVLRLPPLGSVLSLNPTLGPGAALGHARCHPRGSPPIRPADRCPTCTLVIPNTGCVRACVRIRCVR